MLLLFISFIAGVLTILAPCILPLLPVIVGHSITDTTPSRRRLFVVVASLSISIVLFTLLLKASSLLINIPEDFWKWISGGIIFLFGLTMVFPSLWEKFSFANTLSLKSNKVLTKGYQKNSIFGDIIIGASLGPIFSACSPTYFVILATVLPVSPLFGIVFILVAIAIISGYDKKLQISLLDAGFLDVTKIEQKLLEKNDKKNASININDTSNAKENAEIPDKIKSNKESFLSIKEKNKKYVLAPEISTPDDFINTSRLNSGQASPITISEFKGKKVVLLDIWTYSCINCQRTIPYLNKWYKEYEDEGLVIIGLHTPEFSFEKIQKNVEKAVKDFGIEYPVVLDNDFSTWNAYENRYWPRK